MVDVPVPANDLGISEVLGVRLAARLFSLRCVKTKSRGAQRMSVRAVFMHWHVPGNRDALNEDERYED